MECEPLAPNYAIRRDRRRGASPTVSVVIASNESVDVLESCISSLQTRFDPSQTEYVLAWVGSAQAGADLKCQFPYVHFVSASASSSSADLRMQGIKAATGDIVLLLQRDQAQDAVLPGVSLASARDGAWKRGNSSKWVEKLPLRAGRQNASAASSG